MAFVWTLSCYARRVLFYLACHGFKIRFAAYGLGAWPEIFFLCYVPCLYFSDEDLVQDHVTIRTEKVRLAPWWVIR